MADEFEGGDLVILRTPVEAIKVTRVWRRSTASPDRIWLAAWRQPGGVAFPYLADRTQLVRVVDVEGARLCPMPDWAREVRPQAQNWRQARTAAVDAMAQAVRGRVWSQLG